MNQGSAPRIAIVAGEPSGDVHGANLVRAVRRRCPQAAIVGMGGPGMAAAGCKLLVNLLELSVMWLRRPLANLFRFIRIVARFEEEIRARRPDVVVLIDYPGLNLVLARAARRHGIPVVYYVCPQFWAWAPWRRKRIARLSSLLLVIFPFEERFFANPTAPVRYVGHPIFDELAGYPGEDRARDLRRGFGIAEGTRILAVLPGSRKQEVEAHTRLMVDAARRIRAETGHVIVVSATRGSFRGIIDPVVEGGGGIRVLDGDVRPLMAAADFALVASGTASLELAFFSVPMVVLYRASPFMRRLYRFMVTSPFISTVNILSGEEVVPERVLDRDDVDLVVSLAGPLARPGPARDACAARLRGLRERFFDPGASDRAAERILAAAGFRG